MNNIAQGMSQTFLSTLDPLLEKFAIGQTVFPAFGNQRANAYTFIKAMGSQLPVAQENFYHFEDTRKQELVTFLNNATAAGPGQPLVATLDPSSYTGTFTYVRKWFNILFPGNVNGTVYDIAVPTITIYPKDSTVTLSVTAGQSLPVTDSNFGEGTNQPKGVVRKLVKRNFMMQILKESYEGSGTAATNEASVDVSTVAKYIPDFIGGQENANKLGLGNTLMLMGQPDMDYRMTAQIAYMIYTGEFNTNSTLLDPDPIAMQGAIRAGQGLYKTTSQFGNTQNYAVGTMSIADFDLASATMEGQNVTPDKPILWLTAYDQYVEFENTMTASNLATFFKYDKEKSNNMIFGSDAGKKVGINFVEFTKGNYTFQIMQDPVLTDPVGLGAPALNNRNLGFMIPLQGVKDGSGKLQDSLTIRYKKLGAWNRMFTMWARGHEVTNYDIEGLYMFCNLGPEFWGANRYILFEGQ